MKSPIIIGIMSLPLLLCSCFPWSPISQKPINNQQNIGESKVKPEIPIVKEVWNTPDQQFTILGYLPSIDCSNPKIIPLGATGPWMTSYIMSCIITDKNKLQDELAYVKRVFPAGSFYWDNGIEFTEYQVGTLLLNGDTATFQLERNDSFIKRQSAYYFKNREAKYNLALKVQNLLGEAKPSNMSIKESLINFPVSIQEYFQVLKNDDSKVILSTPYGYWYSNLLISEIMPIPEGKNFFDTKWPKINNEKYSMTIIYTWSHIWEDYKAGLDFMANPRNVEAVYLRTNGGDTTFLLKPDVLK